MGELLMLSKGGDVLWVEAQAIVWNGTWSTRVAVLG
jgi:hypothetical protein